MIVSVPQGSLHEAVEEVRTEVPAMAGQPPCRAGAVERPLLPSERSLDNGGINSLRAGLFDAWANYPYTDPQEERQMEAIISIGSTGAGDRSPHRCQPGTLPHRIVSLPAGGRKVKDFTAPLPQGQEPLNPSLGG